MFFHFQNQDRETKFEKLVYKRLATRFKCTTSYKTLVRNPSIFQSQYQDLKDKGVLCPFKIKMESQNSEHGWIKDQWPYPNEDQDARPQSGASSILQSPKLELKGHRCSLHLQNQDRKPNFGSWVYLGPVTIYKAWSRCQIPVSDLQSPPKPKSRLEIQRCTLHLQNH